MKELFSIKSFPAEGLNKRDVEDSTVSEALQTIYPKNKSSNLCMIWNGVVLGLEMHDEVADIYWDIIKMLYDMYEQPLSSTRVHWGSSVFMAEWIIKPYNDTLYISAYWTALKHKKHLLPELNTPNDTIYIKREVFIAYWLQLLRKIQIDLKQQGYNESNLEDFYHIDTIFKYYHSHFK